MSDDCGQSEICAESPGCSRHWAERVREVMAERDEARAEVERLKAHFILIAQACGNEDPDTAHHAVRARVAERDAAVAKAAAYERDWYAAKSEFGTAIAKLRERLRSAERERDDTRRELRAVGATTAPLYTSQEREVLIRERDEARAEADAVRKQLGLDPIEW